MFYSVFRDCCMFYSIIRDCCMFGLSPEIVVCLVCLQRLLYVWPVFRDCSMFGMSSEIVVCLVCLQGLLATESASVFRDCCMSSLIFYVEIVGCRINLCLEILLYVEFQLLSFRFFSLSFCFEMNVC